MIMSKVVEKKNNSNWCTVENKICKLAINRGEKSICSAKNYTQMICEKKKE